MKAHAAILLLVGSCLALGTGWSQRGGGPPPGGGGPPGGGSGGPGGPGGQPGGPGGLGSPGAPPPGGGANRGPNGGTRNSAQFGPVGRWWDDKSVMKSVGLSKEQQKKMDTIFDADKPEILSSYKTLLSKQSKLDALNKDPKVDKATLFAAIDAVNEARAALQKTTAQMFLEIREQMSSDQIGKLEKLP